MLKRIALFVTVFLAVVLISAAVSVNARTSARPTGYKLCAVEDAVCSMTGPGLIVFGGSTGGYTDPIALNEAVACTRGNFGNSAPGAKSACYVKYKSATPPPAPPAPPAPVPVDPPAAGGPKLFNLPPPNSLHQVPPGWSAVNFFSSTEPAAVPAQCVRSDPAKQHAATVTGQADGKPFTYTICETDAGLIGWWSIAP